MGCGVKLIYYMQKFFIRGDIRHRPSIMRKADISLGIYDAVQRHASQLEQIHFLAVGSRHGMVRVGQADEGDAFIFPILLEDGD